MPPFLLNAGQHAAAVSDATFAIALARSVQMMLVLRYPLSAVGAAQYLFLSLRPMVM